MRVGIVSDTHFPAVHPGYFDFVQDIFEAWGVNKIVHIGDVCDLHNPSFHDNAPHMSGATQECVEAQEHVDKWRRVFPKMYVMIGNHDRRSIRVASKYGVDPDKFLKSYSEVWNTPQWTWAKQLILDGTLFCHGDRKGAGENPAYNFLKKGVGMSVAIGHWHSRAGIKWMAGPKSRWFAMDVGSGVDGKHPAMEYSADNALRDIISCAVVIDEMPYLEICPCGPKERYHRSKF